jgi:capsular polysaccharide biosynthesis protein
MKNLLLGIIAINLTIISINLTLRSIEPAYASDIQRVVICNEENSKCARVLLDGQLSVK